VFSADELGSLQKLLSQFGLGNERGVQSDKGSKQNKHNNTSDKDSNCPKLDTAQLLVIVGILSGGLIVRSVWVNNDQTVQVILTGNLKRKTHLEKVMGQIGQMSFDEVIKAILANNL
jgi:hypothetical protein